MKAQTPINADTLRRYAAPLMAAWERQSRRIDALSLRERAILFACLVAVLAAAFESLVLAPNAERLRQREQAQARQVAELTQLREQFVAASGDTGEAPAPLRARLDAARQERGRLDDALREAASVSAGEGLPAVLQRLLARQPGLVLERLRLLDDVPVTLPAAAASGPTVAPPPAFAGMSWQGVELQVQGSYQDALRYLQALEREMPGLRWGELRLAGGQDGSPPRLQAQVFLLKVQP